MLVLSRRIGEGIVFKIDRSTLAKLKEGENILIYTRVIDGNNSRVRIGIDAPRSVEVLRDELVTQTETEISF